jgi:hypothetical protein
MVHAWIVGQIPLERNTDYYGWSHSPDLSTKDPARIVASGGIVGGDLGRFHGEVVFSMAPSDVRMGLIRTGTSDGKGLAHDGRRQELE